MEIALFRFFPGKNKEKRKTLAVARTSSYKRYYRFLLSQMCETFPLTLASQLTHVNNFHQHQC